MFNNLNRIIKFIQVANSRNFEFGIPEKVLKIRHDGEHYGKDQGDRGGDGEDAKYVGINLSDNPH